MIADETQHINKNNGKKLKIAMLTTTFFPQIGGAEYQVKWLAEVLAEKGHQVYLFTPYDARDFIDVKDNGFPRNIALRKEGTNVFLDAFTIVYTFGKWIRKIRPDIVHAHYAFSSGLLAVLTKPIHKAPVVITSHGEDVQVVKEINYGMRLKLHRRLFIYFALKLCDAHVIVSESMRKDAIKSGSRNDRVYVIYNMYNPPPFAIDNDFIKSVKEKYNIPTQKKIILSVSRLHKKKGLEYLIKSMKYVIENVEAHLVIAGDGPERKRLERLAKQENLENHITFTGFVDEKEKHALIKCCDIFCMPSIKEGLPIALFDPMYYSKAVVVTNIGPILEILGGEYKYAVNKADPHQLSKAISELITANKEREQIGDSLRRQLEKFLPENIASEYERLYYKMLERRVKTWKF